MISFGNVPAGSVLPFIFNAYNAAGASVTLTGIATTDIEVYKGTSVTQRSSDNGYALIDTDGIDIDGVTGIHGFSIDTGDNTDSGFYSVGSFFTVVVASVTIDGQTVNFVAGTFRLVAAEGQTGYPKVDTQYIEAVDATNQINAEVLDVLNVDTFAQPGQGAPAATQSIRAMIAYLYKAWRNRTTQTASQYSLYNDDATTIDHKSTTSDNGTTFDSGEVASGP